MQKKPLVSVVIITYNQEQFIEQTIDCVLAQETEYDYEIIIGEDCSTDGTREIVYRYQREYPEKIRVITSDKNVGLLDNYYRTVKVTRGKYIAGCGGDDYWHNPEKLQKQVKFLEANSEYGMVHSDENVLYEDTGDLTTSYNMRSKYSYDDKSEKTLELLFAGKYRIVASSAVFRKRFFDEHFDLNELKRNQIVIEDMPLWLILAAYSKIHYMAESFVTRRVVKGSITRQGIDKRIELVQSVYNCYLLYYEKYEGRMSDMGVGIGTIHALLNRLMLNHALKANRKDLVRCYYKNIVNLAGASYLGLTDKLHYYVTYIPFGSRIYNSLLWIYRGFNELATGVPRRGV